MNTNFTKKPAHKRIPIHWQEAVRFEGLNIRHIGLQQSISHLPQTSGEKFDKPLHFQRHRLTVGNTNPS
jgi:hypothetical protein